MGEIERERERDWGKKEHALPPKKTNQGSTIIVHEQVLDLIDPTQTCGTQ